MSELILYTCPVCNKTFTLTKQQASARNASFCSIRCANLGRVRPTEERFWRKVDKNGPVHASLQTRCWLWNGNRTPLGYGRLSIGGRESPRRIYAHRLSYEVTIGAVPDGMCVLHRCDVPSCVNPEHLFLGTILDNNADMVRKRRNVMGAKVTGAKLTDDKVREIRRLCSDGKPRAEVAADFNVSFRLVTLIARGSIWKHVL